MSDGEPWERSQRNHQTRRHSAKLQPDIEGSIAACFVTFETFAAYLVRAGASPGSRWCVRRRGHRARPRPGEAAQARAGDDPDARPRHVCLRVPRRRVDGGPVAQPALAAVRSGLGLRRRLVRREGHRGSGNHGRRCGSRARPTCGIWTRGPKPRSTCPKEIVSGGEESVTCALPATADSRPWSGPAAGCVRERKSPERPSSKSASPPAASSRIAASASATT